MWHIRIRKAAIVAVGVVIAICALAQSLAAQTATIQQYNFNPVRIVGGGYIPSIIENKCGTKYLRTDMGGVYRYDTNQWTELLDWLSPAQFQLTGPESIATDPNNCSMLYIAAGMYTTVGNSLQSNLYAFLVSSDGGQTFNTYPETAFEIASNNDGRAAGERLAVNPFNSSELLFGSRHNSIQRSTNQAQTWTTVAGLPFYADSKLYGVQVVIYDPCYSNEVGCGTTGSTARVFASEYGNSGAAPATDHGLYVSNDDGNTWTLLAGQPTAWTGGTGVNLGITNSSCGTSSHPPVPEKMLINPDGHLYVDWTDQSGPNTETCGAVTKYDLTSAATGWTNITPPPDTVNDATNKYGGFDGLTQNWNLPVGSPATIAVSTHNRSSSGSGDVDAIYITYNGGTTWTNISDEDGSSNPDVPNMNGDNGVVKGVYYYNSSVYNSGNVETSAPFLSFGNTENPKTPNPSAYVGWWMSSLFLDSLNPNTLMYSTGANIFRTDDVNDPAPNWYVNGWGVDQTAVLALASPSGPPSTADPTTGGHLFSGVGDIGGFLHTNFNESPGTGQPNTTGATTPGMYTNPVPLHIGGLDWAGQYPSFIVRAENPASVTTSPCSSGAYSSTGGVSWAPFASCALGASNSDATIIAVDASGMEVMWEGTSGTDDQYIRNTGTPAAPVFGSTWTSTTGQPTHLLPWADKVQPNMFYSWYSSSGSTGGFYSTGASNGTVWTKSAGQPSVTTTGTCMGQSYSADNGCGRVMPNPYVAGDIWLPLGTNGLYHSTDFGATWTQITNVTGAYGVGVGAPAPGTTTAAVFLFGTLTSPTQPASMGSAIYRADDAAPANAAPSWIQVNDAAHQYGGATLIVADPNVYGQFYIGMFGRGIIYGAPAPSTVTTSPAGLSFTADGTSYIGPQNFPWAPNSTHTLAAPSPQIVGATTYTFTDWSIPGSTSSSNPLSVTVPVPPTSPGTYVANFAASATVEVPLTGTLTGKSGLSQSRAWTITLTNPAAVAATGAQINSLTLNWTGGTQCQPMLSTPLPLAVGTIPANGGTGSGTILINFAGEGCATTSRFTANFTFSGSTGAGSTTLNNQFQ